MVYAGVNSELANGSVDRKVDDSAVRTQLERIRTSPDFHVPERARSFLTYIVEQTLAGRADRIKAYSIATEVFGRDATFDAQNDPIVRIEAGRIRQALEKYYLTAGTDDPIRIGIPKGGYVPTFEKNPAAVATTAVDLRDAPPRSAVPGAGYMKNAFLAHPFFIATAVLFLAVVAGYLLPFPAGGRNAASAEQMTKRELQAPKLQVEQFEDLAGTSNSAIVARGLTEELVGQLARFREITVLAPSKAGEPLGTIASGDDPPRFRLEGSVRTSADRLRLVARLVEIGDDQIIWSNIYDEKLDVRQLVELQESLARDVSLALAQPYGIIFRSDADAPKQVPPGDWQAYECTLAYYTYRVELKPETHDSIQQCLTRTTQKFPGYATAWALLSLTYSDEVRFKYRLGTNDPTSLTQAVAMAERAKDADPANVRGLEAMMIALYLSGRVEEALAIGKEGYEKNPNDMEFAGEYGNRLALSGSWTEGCAMMLEARNSSSAPPGYFEVPLAVCAYMQGNYQAAEDWIKVAPATGNPVYHFVAAAIAGQLGNRSDIENSRSWIESHAPLMLQNIRREVAMRIIQPEDQELFLDGLHKAGMAAEGVRSQ
ncbi:MAG: hypothetical protein JNK47_13865 [Mesorhizobium sp.]|nr:hypothetical protein [Mesorhizobium sp.]MBL8578307.1 hypothetical protein [Mesorhizobium sp.]